MNVRTILFSIVVLIVILGLRYFSWQDDRLHIHVLDVGQGDAILVEFPDETLMLIDGGGGDYVLSQLGEILPPWVRTIDIVVLTHPHMDHLGGLLDIVNRYAVREVWMNPIEYELHEYYVFGEMIDGKMVVLRGLELGRDWWAGGAEVLVFDGNLGRCGELESGEGPLACQEPFSGSTNNISIVILLRYGSFEMLLSGDAEHEVEDMILSSPSRSYFHDIDVHKAGHHCSKTASSEAFLRHISPDLAICSCGAENSFGHPHKETLDLFEKYDISYMRTDEDGRVSISSDGVKWWLE